MRLALIAAFLLDWAPTAMPQSRRAHPAGKPAQPSLEQDQKAIEQLHQRDIAASIALDVDSLLAIRTDDIVYLVPGHPPIVGQDAVRKYMQDIRRQLANWDMVGYEENWQEVRVVGDTAIEWGTLSVRVKPPDSNRESAALRGIMQELRRQPDGSWKIARVIWNVQSPQPAPSTETAKPRDKPGA